MNRFSDQVKRELIDCVKKALAGMPVESKPTEELLKFARIHSLGHLVGSQSDALLAVARSQVRAKALNDIRKILNNSALQFIPLKGAVLCKLYPKEWMRSSSDLDILIHPNDFEELNKLFIGELAYKCIYQDEYHAGYIVNENMHVEIHYELFFNDKDDPWEHAIPVKEGDSEYRFSDDYFVSYLLRHMKKHFLAGGCGLRSMVDLYLLNQNGFILPDDSYSNLCKEFLRHFDEENLEFSEFDQLVLECGNHGTDYSIAAAGLAKYGSGFKYTIRHMFPPFSDMVLVYPWLKKNQVLLPFAWIKYGIFRLNNGHIANLKHELTSNSNADLDMVKSMRRVFAQID